MNINRALCATLVPFLIIACGPGDAKQGNHTETDAGTGGKTTASTAGAKATGGAGGASHATGGKASVGGSSTAGNSSVAGNTGNTGGSTSASTALTGGGTSVAGDTSVGGNTATTGGVTSTGTGGVATTTGGSTGASTGGAGTATGGVGTATGGVKATGGSGTTAGTGVGGGATGGVAATGGSKAATGGVAPTGGVAATGGASGITCIAGDPCTSASIPVCHSGKTTCSGSNQTCADAGAAPNGTSCGTDMVCHNGACAACQAGASCASPDPCGAATYSCSLGVPVCSVTSAAKPDGTQCGLTTFGTCQAGHCQCPTGSTYYQGDCNDCPGFSNPTGTNTVYVNADPSVGQDNICCGRATVAGIGGPCATITQALQIAGTNWSISVTGDAAGGNASPNEAYPIHVGKGITIAGSGTVCVPGASGKNIFDVDLDQTQVTIQGLTIGRNCQGVASGAMDGIYVGPGAKVYAYYPTVEKVANGLHVDGGTVVGAVTINRATNYGVWCQSTTNTSSNSTITSSMTVSGATNADIFASTNCNIGATGSTIGVSLGTSSGACLGVKQDNIGIYAEANAKVYVGGSIRCMNADGISLRAASGAQNTPYVFTYGMTIAHSGCNGIYAEVGSMRSYYSTIMQNHWGVLQRSPNASTVATDALINLSGTNNTTTYRNIFKCNGKSEPGACCTSTSCPSGGDIWNNSGLPLDATDNAWPTGLISKCVCDAALQTCNCAPTATSIPDGVDVLISPYSSSGNGTVTTTGFIIEADTACPQ